MSQANESNLPAHFPAPPEGCESWGEVIERARRGDRSAIQPLRTLLRSSRGAPMAFGGDLSWEAIVRLLRSFVGDNVVLREAIMQQLDNLRIELCGANPFPIGIERLLIENVVGTWLHFHRLEVLYGEQEKPNFRTDGYFQRELTAAHGRYLAALRALIDARRRPLPNIQINVANEQVKVAANATPAPLG